MKIFLVRHTSVNSDPKMCYGWTDVDVSENFLPEARRVKEFFLDEEFICYSSDLKRCVKLAEFFSDKIKIDSGLREVNFGQWERKSWNDIEKEMSDIKPFDFVNHKTPGGESFKDQSLRVLKSWQNIVNSHDNSETIVIVAHGGTIRIILCHLLGMPLENAFKIKIDYASLTSVTLDNEFVTVNKVNY